MKDWNKVVFLQSTKIIDVVKAINEAGTQFAVIVNDNDQLAGVVTDGDIRRGILAGVDFSSDVASIMNPTPKKQPVGASKDAMIQFMKENQITFIPIVETDGRINDVLRLPDLTETKKNSIPVVLMAGGLGSRLGKLTDDCPKPLLKVGNKPLLETIIENFVSQGFSDFHLSLNYRSRMIMDQIGDGSRWGAKIQYILEDKKLGTAGALGLAKLEHNGPVIVMNADLLTKVNFSSLLEFHADHNSVATMCVRKYDMEVPYGVVKTKDSIVSGIKEKPTHSFFVNAGVYVVDTSILKYIKKDEYLDMPSFLDLMIKEDMQVSAFPIHEYWLDIGRHEDFEQANTDFRRHFN